jgi:hypothetical protein
MAKKFVQPYVANMKATPSTAGEVQNEQAPATRLPVSAWEEETFALRVRDVGATRPTADSPDWENIEAIGAADDPARFSVEFPVTESTSACP